MQETSKTAGSKRGETFEPDVPPLARGERGRFAKVSRCYICLKMCM